MRKRPSDDERRAAREYLEHDYTRRRLTGPPAEEAHRNAEEIRREHPRARQIALAGGHADLGRLPSHLRRHQLRERAAAGITTRRAAELRRRGYPEQETTRRRTGRERVEDIGDVARQRGGELAATTYNAAADTSWGDLIGQLFLWGVGLSIGYLLLSGKGPTAISKLFVGATTVTRGVISPAVDPLNPKGALL